MFSIFRVEVDVPRPRLLAGEHGTLNMKALRADGRRVHTLHKYSYSALWVLTRVLILYFTMAHVITRMQL